MPTEIYNNLSLKKGDHLDSRLSTVVSYASLPDPLDDSNFLYEGALVYVSGENKYYRLELISLVLTWVAFDYTELSIGVINLLSGYPILDLSLCTPPLPQCWAVQINIVGGAGSNIQSIVNLPSDGRPITLYTEAGKVIRYVHTDYDVASTDQIVIENGFDLSITGRVIGNDSVTFRKHGTVNCQWDAVQFMKASEWAGTLLDLAVEDVLTSTSTETALSANQGRILKGLVDTKQDILIPGDKINIVGANIHSVARNWVKTTPAPGVIADLEVLLTTLFSDISLEYRYVDLRAFPLNPDLGLWLLPPSKNPTLIGNWINIDKAEQTTQTASYKYVADTSVNTSVISGVRYHPRVKVDSLIGADLGLSWNSDGLANEKTNFSFSKTGIYELEINLVLSSITTVSLADIPAFDATLYTTNNVQLASDPINTGVLVSRESYPAQFSGNTVTRYPSVKLTYVVNVSTIGIANGFTVAIDNNSTGTFTNFNLTAYSSIKITKLS